MDLLKRVKIRRRPWMVLVSVLVFGAMVSAALLVSASIGVRMVERYVPLQDASMMIKHELGMFRLALEAATRSGRAGQADEAWSHLDRAEDSARLMLTGGVTAEGSFKPLEDPARIREITRVIQEFSEIRAVAEKRLTLEDTSQAGIEQERKFEAVFAHILTEADDIERGLHEKTRASLAEYEAIAAGLFISALLFTIVAGIALYRYASRQAGYITTLMEYGERLEEKELDLAGALDKARESEGKFRVLVEKSLTGVYIIQDGRFRYVNPTLCELLGYSSDEMLAMKDFIELVTPEDRPLVDEKVADRLSGRVDTVRYTSRWLRKDGETIDVDTMGSLTNFNGRPALIGTLLDITERKRADEELRLSETKYRIVADNTYDWEFWIAPDGRFLYTSPSCERVTGHTAGEFEADPGLLSRIIHQDDKAAFTMHRHDVGETPGGLEFRIITPDGTERWIEHLCQPVYDENGQFLGHRGNNRDITDRKKLERDRADFYAMVTHDLKSPLSAILGYSELLQTAKAECMDGEPGEMVAGISRSAGKLLRMVEDFLSVSRMENGLLKASAVPDDMPDALKDTITEFDALARKKGLEFRRELQDGLPVFAFDRKLLQRAVANLLQNAVNYTPKGGMVTLAAVNAEDGRSVVISVKDSGPGIPADEREKVFDKYYRSAGTAYVRGSGLGLTIVKAVAEAHGGRVELVSEPGKGSEFRIFMPAA